MTRTVIAYVPSIMLSAFAVILLLVEYFVGLIPIPSECGPYVGDHCSVPAGTLQAVSQLESALFISSIVTFVTSAAVAVIVWSVARRRGGTAASDPAPDDGSTRA